MKKIFSTAVALVVGLVVGGGVVAAAAPQKFVNDIYRDSNNGVIGVFDDQTNKCYVYYNANGTNGAQSGKSIYCVKR